jgi:hypothetical protein
MKVVNITYLTHIVLIYNNLQTMLKLQFFVKDLKMRPGNDSKISINGYK